MGDARDITEALGGTWNGQYGTACCPAHDNTRTPALSISMGDNEKLLLKCHAGCSFREVIAALLDQGIVSRHFVASAHPFGTSENPVNKHSSERQEQLAQNIWQCTLEIEGTPADAYLRSRGVKCGNIMNLRYAPICHHPSGELSSAMVGLIEGSNGYAVHCTYLDDAAGKKAEVDPQKVMFGRKRFGDPLLPL
ncbi:MAG: hypothetical protein RID23_20880 [Roseovarius sp.]